MKLYNYTPHPVTILHDDGEVEIIPTTGLARCSTREVEVSPIETPSGRKFPTKMKYFGEVTGLPDPQNDIGYIVSMAVANASPQRHDLYVPGDTLRKTDGTIIGCRSLWYVG